MAVAGSPNAPRRHAVGAREQAPSRRGRLAVVSARRLGERNQRRRARAICLLAAALVVGALLAVVGGQALVASQQVHLDNVRAELATASAANASLSLRRAQLTAPLGILEVAEHQLHMVAPGAVTYLPPVKPGPLAFSDTECDQVSPR